MFIAAVAAERCPAPLTIQDPTLAKNFQLSQFVGPAYYELALHDYTQPSICGCMRSVKNVELTNEGSYIHDNFTMVCPFNKDKPNRGAIYISDLNFNLTEDAAVLNGHWAVTGGTVFPDTIVAVGKPDVEGAPYRWALEFQCVEELYEIVFVGINFYARDNLGAEADRSYNEMVAAAKEYSVSHYWGDVDSGLRRIDHTNCFYDQNPTKTSTYI